MNALKFEWTLLTRSKPTLIAVIILSLLSIFAVGRGLTEVGRQSAVISHLESLQKSDMADLAKAYGPEGDAGYVAYYSFFHTFDPPSNLAFAALGQRDVLPYNLRVRALGLQAQLYEGDIFNPELALPGRFDLSFVLIYLAPLFLVVLLHDLVSHEAETGRLNLLRASPKVGGGFWARRAGLRGMLIWAAVAVPFMAGAMIAQAPFIATLEVLGLMALYVAFWTGLCLVTSAFGLGSRLNTLALLSQWMVLVLIAPVVAHIAISRAVPVPQGVDIVLKQRQSVHGAWEVPKVLTMERFFQTHPEWKNTPPLGEAFEWKWYFAFHQLGDETVSSDVQAYRDSIERRQDYAQGVGFFLPSVGTQLMLERLADTDIKRYLGYQQQVADFHTALRHFYYPYIFNKVAFHETEFAKAPRFEAKPHSSGGGILGLVALLGLTALIWWAGLRLLRQRLG
ncbi:hypothetical protein MMA231_03733 (plasmid) [Asticcacaulis sp. MM231]|uniref:DUF3526 domain-containing protein n=1 Tax=Asticcacaulis sp. MM231 TaxID=3157666 RepID=UPI0032D56CC1